MTTAGTINKTNPVSFTEVRNINAKPPIKISKLRKAIEIDEPKTDRIRVVSVVMRLSTSPVSILSKKDGLIMITRSKTARRISATTRSPRRVTKE